MNREEEQILSSMRRRDFLHVSASAALAALALIRIDPTAAEPAIPVLIEGLKSSDERTRWDTRRCFLCA